MTMIDSLHLSLLNAVQARIFTMISDSPSRLDGFVVDSVRVRKVPDFSDFGSPSANKNFTFPGILICHMGTEKVFERSNVRTDRGYPALIVIANQESTSDVTEKYETGEGPYLAWREALMNEFITRGIITTTPVAATFNKCEYENGNIADWMKFANEGLWFSSLLFRFSIYQPRIAQTA